MKSIPVTDLKHHDIVILDGQDLSDVIVDLEFPPSVDFKSVVVDKIEMKDDRVLVYVLECGVYDFPIDSLVWIEI